MENEIRCEEWTGQKDYFGYIYATLDQKHNLLYIGQKKGLVEDSEDYFGSGSIIKKKIKSRGVYFLKRRVLGVCYSKEELTKCETECKLFFNVLDKKYGYNIILEDTGGDTLSNHPDKEEIIKKVVATRKKRDNYPKKGEVFFTEEHKRNISIARSGTKLSEDHKQSISDSMKGEKNHFYGKKHTEESLKKISDSLKGKGTSDWQKKRVSETHLGIPLLEEHKNKISDALKMDINLEEIKRLYLEKYSINEIADILGVNRSTIYRRVKYDLKLPISVYDNNKVEVDLDKIKELYEKDYSQKEIADILGVTVYIINSRLNGELKDFKDKIDRKRGENISGKNNGRFININVQKVLELYKNGMKIEDIAKEFQVTEYIIKNRIKDPKKYI